MSKNPIATLYNYPPKIQERVKSMEQYKDKIPTTQNKIWAKTSTGEKYSVSSLEEYQLRNSSYNLLIAL